MAHTEPREGMEPAGMTVELDAFLRQLEWLGTQCAGRAEHHDRVWMFTRGAANMAEADFREYRMWLQRGQWDKADARAAKLDVKLKDLSWELRQLRKEEVMAETADLLRQDLHHLRSAAGYAAAVAGQHGRPAPQSAE